MKILIGNYTVSVNKAELIEQIKNIETDVERAYNIHGDADDDVESWITSDEYLELAKNVGIKFVEDLTEESLKTVFENSCHITKRCLLAKNRRFIAENLDITTRYDNEHGCHSYTNEVLEFIENGFDVELQLTSKDYQSSF